METFKGFLQTLGFIFLVLIVYMYFTGMLGMMSALLLLPTVNT